MDLTPRKSGLKQSSATLVRLLHEISGYALAGIIGAIVLLWLFGYLAEEVFDKEFTSFDNGFELGLHRFATPFLDSLFRVFTTIGSIAGVAILTVVTFGLLIWRKHLRSAWTLAIIVAGGIILNQALKFFFHRPRPELWPMSGPQLTTFSFPSGHATVSLCYCGFLIWFGWRFIRPTVLKVLWTILMLGVILMVGLSRIYFGVHYPTDVIGGYLSGSFWLVMVLSGETIYRRFRTSR